MVSDALTRLGGLTGVEVEPTQRGELFDETRYRNKVSLVPRVAGARGELGFYAARTHRVVPVEHCPVLLPWLDDAVRALVRFVEKHPQFLRDMRHLVLRTGVARKTLVVALCTEGPQRGLTDFIEELRRQIPALSGIVASWDPSSANAIFGRRFATLWGSPETIEKVAGASFHFGIASFFQINTGVLERIVEHLGTSLHGARRIVDLYCGVGTFAVLLAKQGMSVTGVESFAGAVEEAAANAAINDVTSAAFECATVTDAVRGARGQTLLRGAGCRDRRPTAARLRGRSAHSPCGRAHAPHRILVVQSSHARQRRAQARRCRLSAGAYGSLRHVPLHRARRGARRIHALEI